MAVLDLETGQDPGSDLIIRTSSSSRPQELGWKFLTLIRLDPELRRYSSRSLYRRRADRQGPGNGREAAPAPGCWWSSSPSRSRNSSTAIREVLGERARELRRHRETQHG